MNTVKDWKEKSRRSEERGATSAHKIRKMKENVFFILGLRNRS